MEPTPKSRVAKRAALLASTAIIALLSACQTPGGDVTSSSGGTVPQKYSAPAYGGYAW